MSNLLSKIKESTKFVSNNSKYVRINCEKIDEILANGEFNDIRYWLDTNPFGLLDMNYREIINFLLLYHTIGDFCFWGDFTKKLCANL